MRVLAFLMLLLPAACGGLPQPFFGNPGGAANRLAQPPPSRLAVLMPINGLLSSTAAATWARATAGALAKQEIPAAVSRPDKRDWKLVLAARLRGTMVVPSYTLQNPAGEAQGVSEGEPVAADDWASGQPAVLRAAAAQVAPGIATLLGRVETARRQSDPASLLNRPARIYLAGVTGAPGDGDQSLPAQMRLKLEKAGLVVQDTPTGADYEVKGQVNTAPGANDTTRVELQWAVSDERGERGKILQINEVPIRTISPYWGDVAVVVADEAATGVRDVINNANGIGQAAKPAVSAPPS